MKHYDGIKYRNGEIKNIMACFGYFTGVKRQQTSMVYVGVFKNN